MWTPPTTMSRGDGSSTSTKSSASPAATRRLGAVRRAPRGPPRARRVVDRSRRRAVLEDGQLRGRRGPPVPGRRSPRRPSAPRGSAPRSGSKTSADERLDEDVDGAAAGEADAPGACRRRRRSGAAAASPLASDLAPASTTAFSTQPPLTEPAIRPSAVSAILPPAGARAPSPRSRRPSRGRPAGPRRASARCPRGCLSCRRPRSGDRARLLAPRGTIRRQALEAPAEVLEAREVVDRAGSRRRTAARPGCRAPAARSRARRAGD